MFCRIRGVMRSLISCALVFVVFFAFGGTTYRDCFEIVPGDLPHIAYGQNKAVDFAIDCFGERGWMVTGHCPRGEANVIQASKGDVVSDQLFMRNYSSVDAGPSETFTFAFRWKCKVTETITIYHYGWVTLGTNNGALAIVASEVADEQNVAIVGYDGSDEPEEIVARPDISQWEGIDHGEWIELPSGCIRRDTEGLVIIPREIKGKPVRVIGNGAFCGCQRVTDVRIPNTVTKIGERAFGSPQLLSVNLPNTIEEIGTGAFADCDNLLSLELPEALSKVGRDAFPNGGKLVVHLPRKEANRLLRIICFDQNKTPLVFDPPNVTFVEEPTDQEKAEGKRAWPFYFENEHLMIGDIRQRPAFPANIAGAVEMPATVAGLPVYGIGNEAFRDCAEVTSVKIANGVRSIGKSAFQGCRRLASIEIPVSVTKIESSAFQECDSIISATLPGGDGKVYDYLPCADKLRFLTIAEGSVSVGESQFCGCSSLLTVTFPSTLRSIGRCAFQGCYWIKSLLLPEGVQVVGESAFSDCHELKSVAFPSSLVSIGGWAFSGCKNLAALNLPEGLRDVGEEAFCCCDGVKLLKIPSSMGYVSDRAFRDMRGLKTLVIDEGVYGIGEESFHGCSELEKVVFPSTLQIIGREAFSSCGLRSLALPDGLLMIDDLAFNGNYDDIKITVPSSLVYIGSAAFCFGSDGVVRVPKGEVERVGDLFKYAGIKFEEGQIVEEGQMAKSELVELADQLVAATFTPAFMQEFAALPSGAEVVVANPNAQPGLCYAIGVSATVEGLGQAVRDAPRFEATSDGVELKVVKPVGDSAFFRMAIEEP